MHRFLILALFLLAPALAHAADTPNIIFILADDMGYGDVSHAGGLAATPHIDRLASEGMRFTDGHTTSSVCTPTRYSILTGRYNWRSPMKKGVLWGMSEPLIPQDRATAAKTARIVMMRGGLPKTPSRLLQQKTVGSS